MNKLLCSILFCCTASSLVNADCSTYPGVKDATFNKEDQCGDVTITCDTGFTMEQGMACIDGEWKYQEPFCKPPECGYNFTNETYVDFNSLETLSNKSETECDKECNDDTKCSTTLLYNNGDCKLFPAPLISLSLDTDLDQCKEKCTEMEDCLMLNHVGANNRCYIFNVTLNNLGDIFGPGDEDDIIAEKFCL